LTPFQIVFDRTFRHVEKIQFVPSRIGQHGTPANPNVKSRGYDRPARSGEPSDGRVHVIHQVVDVTVSRNIWIVVKNDLRISFGHSETH